jgi:thiol-disulfide isomerase/thioredoxin
LRPYIRGEDRPYLDEIEEKTPYSPGSVKILTTLSFDDFAYDEEKDVFIKFYAPWCPHCHEMKADWE